MSVQSDGVESVCIELSDECFGSFVPSGKFHGNYCPACRNAMEMESDND